MRSLAIRPRRWGVLVWSRVGRSHWRCRRVWAGGRDEDGGRQWPDKSDRTVRSRESCIEDMAFPWLTSSHRRPLDRLSGVLATSQVRLDTRNAHNGRFNTSVIKKQAGTVVDLSIRINLNSPSPLSAYRFPLASSPLTANHISVRRLCETRIGVSTLMLVSYHPLPQAATHPSRVVGRPS